MKIFIFEEIEQLTYNYHSGGGLVVVAQDQVHAKELVSADSNIVLDKKDWSAAKIYDVRGKVESTMYIFPDAGCC